MPTIIQATDSTIPSFISPSVSLADKNWFKTGGPAKWYATPQTAEEFAQALAFARQHREPIFVLGEGANILISDEGFDGLVIKPHLQTISFTCTESHALITAGSGVTIPDLINYCLDNNLLGLEEFSGIPGTVGGAVFINLHYFEFLLGQFLESARVINRHTGIIEHVGPEWFNFGYDISKLHDHEFYLIDATFRVRQGTDLDAAFARGRRQEIIRHRERRYPRSHTCGSFFRNFHPEEVTLEMGGKKMTFVAYYLDKLGVKGHLRIGNATVSYQHANMLVNLGNATSSDLITVARTMQEMVHKEFGIIPQPECILVGFKKQPLL